MDLGQVMHEIPTPPSPPGAEFSLGQIWEVKTEGHGVNKEMTSKEVPVPEEGWTRMHRNGKKCMGKKKCGQCKSVSFRSFWRHKVRG